MAPLHPIEVVLCMATAVSVARAVPLNRLYLQGILAAALNLMFLGVAAHDSWILIAGFVVLNVLLVSPWVKGGPAQPE